MEIVFFRLQISQVQLIKDANNGKTESAANVQMDLLLTLIARASKFQIFVKLQKDFNAQAVIKGIF
jgi:hypothetical protein